MQNLFISFPLVSSPKDGQDFNTYCPQLSIPDKLMAWKTDWRNELTIKGKVPVELSIPLGVAHSHDETQHNQQEEQQNDQVVGLFVHLATHKDTYQYIIVIYLAHFDL